MAVVFYISGHGFGHASRQVEVINALGTKRPDVPIVVRTAASPTLLTRTIRVPYDLRPGACDSGIVQTSSVEYDDAASVREAIAFYSTFDRRIAEEVTAISSDQVRLIVGDIPPLAFEVAARLDVPSIAIGNFTWDWIYETHPGLVDAAAWLPGRIRRAYATAGLALRLPFAGGFGVFHTTQAVPLICRRPTQPRDATRRDFHIPADRPAVLLSFGGYGMPSLDLSAVDCPEWTLVVTDRIVPHGDRSLPAHIVYVEEE